MELFKPDWLFWEERFRSDLVLEVSEQGSVSAGPASDSRPAVRLPGRALLPGLVNGHSHAFQRLIRARTEFASSDRANADFWSWREAMYRATSALEPEDLYAVSRQAFVEMALAGITTVGEFHYLHHDSRGAP